MEIETLLNNSEQYVGNEIIVSGILHYERPHLRTCYLAKQGWNLPNIPKDERLELQWQLPIEEERDSSEIIAELAYLLNGNIGLSPSTLASYIQRLPYYPFGELINMVEQDLDPAEPFIDTEIETQALLLLSKLVASSRPPVSIKGLASFDILDVSAHNSHHYQWRNGSFTGMLEKADDELTLTNVWKAVIYANDCDIYLLPRNRISFLDTFNNVPAYSLKSILQNPEEFYGQEICIRALFSNDFVDYGNDIRYTRLIPNRLYYEFRSRWNKQVSIYLRPSPLVNILTGFRTELATGGYSTNPNRHTAEVRITGTLYPPENEHSSIILDDVTDLVSLHLGRVYHWHLETLKNGRKRLSQ